MRDPRNPFQLRKSEVIDSDSAFLNLFEPGMLDILPAQDWYGNVRPIRSAAGGGKTSMLRLFTPDILHLLHQRQSEPAVKDLFARVEELGAIHAESGPRVLGVMLSCGRNYSHLQDLGVDQTRRDRLFFSLLNVRIILAALRAAISFAGLRYPDDLNQLEFADLPESKTVPGLPLPCTGETLREWAASTEEQICAALDSFRPIEEQQIPGHDSLVSLWLVQPDVIRINGEPIVDGTLVMMDDIHQLSAAQRRTLLDTVTELRSRVGIWIAERLEALSADELLSSGSVEGRDHERPVVIEDFWRRTPDKFEKHCLRAADRRVQAAAAAEMGSYAECVTSNLRGECDDLFQQATTTVESRVRSVAESTKKFSEWLTEVEHVTVDTTPQEVATTWRALEILMERESRKRQRTLFDEPLSTADFQKKFDSSLRNAAELFLAREFDIPYYYGTERLSRLASINVEQFVRLAGDAFEEVLARRIRNPREALPAERQHALMLKLSQTVWDEIPVRVRDGRALRNLLEGIAGHSRWYTYRPSAPNDPGVGGTAIRMSERDMLRDPEYLKRHPEHRRLGDLIASALAHNLLVAQLDYGVKNDRWMVLNLNRILCVKYQLPLNYGLFKERPLSTLAGWVNQRYVEPEQEATLL